MARIIARGGPWRSITDIMDEAVGIATKMCELRHNNKPSEDLKRLAGAYGLRHAIVTCVREGRVAALILVLLRQPKVFGMPLRELMPVALAQTVPQLTRPGIIVPSSMTGSSVPSGKWIRIRALVLTVCNNWLPTAHDIQHWYGVANWLAVAVANDPWILMLMSSHGAGINELLSTVAAVWNDKAVSLPSSDTGLHNLNMLCLARGYSMHPAVNVSPDSRIDFQTSLTDGLDVMAADVTTPVYIYHELLSAATNTSPTDQCMLTALSKIVEHGHSGAVSMWINIMRRQPVTSVDAVKNWWRNPLMPRLIGRCLSKLSLNFKSHHLSRRMLQMTGRAVDTHLKRFEEVKTSKDTRHEAKKCAGLFHPVIVNQLAVSTDEMLTKMYANNPAIVAEQYHLRFLTAPWAAAVISMGRKWGLPAMNASSRFNLLCVMNPDPVVYASHMRFEWPAGHVATAAFDSIPEKDLHSALHKAVMVGWNLKSHRDVDAIISAILDVLRLCLGPLELQSHVKRHIISVAATSL